MALWRAVGGAPQRKPRCIAGRIAWGACVVGVLHIIREARYRRDPHSHDIKPIATAHEGRLVPLEDDRAREWSEIA
jgi:hypothetical protein